METPKRLNEVLPPEKRVIEALKLVDVLGKTLVLHAAQPLSTTDTGWYKMDVSIENQPTHFHVTVNQEQITSILKYLNEQKAYPVLVRLVSYGKSYAMVDPEEYGSKPLTQTQPSLLPENKDQPK